MKYELMLMKERAEGRAEGRMIGKLAVKISSVRNSRGRYDDKLIAYVLDMSEQDYNAISGMIDNNPDWTDEDIAEEMLGFRE